MRDARAREPPRPEGLPELPPSGKLTPEDGKRLDEIRDKLEEILELLVPKESEKARFELVPFRRSVRFPGGAGKNPMGDPHRPYLS